MFNVAYFSPFLLKKNWMNLHIFYERKIDTKHEVTKMFDLPLGFGYVIGTKCSRQRLFYECANRNEKEMIYRAQQLQSDEEMLRYVGLAKKTMPSLL